jgi:hypothetical protein
MAKFMTRVILHGSDSAEQYERLDAAMFVHGFSRELPGKKAVYQLPVGEYWHVADATASEVRTLAATAAEKNGQKFGVIAVQVNGWSVMGLQKSPAPAAE